MSAFRTMLSIANVGISAANYSRLHELQSQQGEAQAMVALLQLAKNMLFSFREAAENALVLEAQNPKLTAVKLRTIQFGMKDIGITPQLFPDLVDKEYASATIKYLGENNQRITSQLSIEEQKDVSKAVSVLNTRADAQYYLDNFHEGRRYTQATRDIAELENRNGCLTNIALILLVYPGIALPSGVLATMFAGMGEAGLWFGGGLGAIVWIAVFTLFMRWRRPRAFREAKKTMASYDESSMNIGRFKKLEGRYGQLGTTKAREAKNSAEKQLAALLGPDAIALLNS